MGADAEKKVGKVAEPLSAWSITFKEFGDAIRTEPPLSEYFVKDWDLPEYDRLDSPLTSEK